MLIHIIFEIVVILYKAKILRMVSIIVKRMSLNSQNSYPLEHPLLLQDHSLRLKNSEEAPIFYYLKTQLWWVTIWNNDPMKNMTWILKTVRELARDSWTKLKDCASALKQYVLPEDIENNFQKHTRCSTRKDPSATSPKYSTLPKKDSHTFG